MRLVCTRNEPDWVLYVAMFDSTDGFERSFHSNKSLLFLDQNYYLIIISSNYYYCKN